MTNPINDGNSPAYSSQPGGGAPAKKTLSIISMVTGILGVLSGFFGFGLLFSLAAIILGHLGQRREKVAGKPFWITGLITGYLGLLVNVIVLAIGIIAVIAIANDPSLQQQLNQ